MSYEPRSLNPNIMEKRINDLSKASGTRAIPIASAETLGGIKVPADSGITIDGSGNAYAYKPLALSYNEVDTGEKWIDNKPIYEKVVPVSLTTIDDSSTTVATDYNFIETLIHSIFIAIKVNNRGCESNCAYVTVEGDLKIHNIERWSELTAAYVVIRYTKVTEEPEEPTEENTEE